MSNYNLVTIDQRFLAETIAKTGSEQLLDKVGRMFVGLYDSEESWYIPLRANIRKQKPKNSYFITHFKNNNSHFKNPGLDFQKAIYVPKKYIMEIKNTLPRGQAQNIFKNKKIIKLKFENYIVNVVESGKMSKAQLSMTAPLLFPEGIMKMKKLIKNNTHNFVKKVNQVSEEEYELAKNTSIIEYAERRGITLVKESGNNYHVDGNSSLKISAEKNLFKEFGSVKNNRKAAGGVINFSKYMKDQNFSSAVKDILEIESSGSFQSDYKKQSFVMPHILEEYDQTNKVATNYLMRRGLNPALIKGLMKSHLISQTKNGEVAFLWKDINGEIVGGTIQGTKKIEWVIVTPEMTRNTSNHYSVYQNEPILNYLVKTKTSLEHYLKQEVPLFRTETLEEAQEFIGKQRAYKKMILKNSESGYGFNFSTKGNKERIVTCESPIDLLSYAGLNTVEEVGSTHYQSLDGLKESVVEASIEQFTKKYGHEPKEVVLAVDNDKAGKEFIEVMNTGCRLGTIQSKPKKTWEERHPDIVLKAHTPKGDIKDWNEFLQEQIKTSLNEKNLVQKPVQYTKL